MKSNVNKYLTGALVALVLVIGGVLYVNSNLRRSNDNWRHNYEVLQDSVNVIKTHHDEVVFENGSLILERNELTKYLNITKDQIKDYEKIIKDKIAYISDLESQLHIKDTVTVTIITHDTLTNSYPLQYRDRWLTFDGVFSLSNPTHPSLDLFNIKMDIPLRVGIGDNYRIFVTSPNPYFNITSIDGAVVDGGQFLKKKKRWHFGVWIGFGQQYGLINKKIDIGPQVGVGFGYSF